MRPNASETAAGLWLAGGVAATVVLQYATDGEHSLSDGLRLHPWVTGTLGVVFACHLARWPARFVRVDPFHLSGWLSRRSAS